MEIKSEKPIQSPLRVEPAGNLGTVGLADITGAHSLYLLQGMDIVSMLQDVFTSIPDEPGDLTIVGENILIRTRHDECILLSKPSFNLQIERNGLTITKMTHGRGILRVRGPQAAETLSKACGLDFSDEAFPDLHAAQTSLAKVHALIIRQDEGASAAYTVVVDRSLTAYVWNVLHDAIHEYVLKT